ncbi:MAG: FxLYD domain-containing protein [Oscillospiraceae bacterium]
MKKIIALLLVFSLCFSLCACGEVEKNDAGFVTNLGKALDARWKLSNKESSPDATTYKQNLTEIVNAELNVLGSYSDYTFTDSKLAELAQLYFEALNKQLEGIPYYGVDDTAYYKIFTSQGYNQRAKVMYEINSMYGLKVADNNASTLTDFLVLGEKVAAIEAVAAQELVLENTGNQCEIVIENNSKFDLSGTELTFNLLDDADVVVGNSIAYIESWPAGSKYRAEIWTDNKDFTHAEMSMQQYSNSIVTEFVPVEYKNEMIIEIEAPDLPKEVSNGYDNHIQSSCIVNSVRSETNYWNNGTAGVNLYFSGTKTFDEDGDDANGHCIFAYKVLDENGNVVASGTTYIDSLKVNDTFKDAMAYADGLAPGNYRIVIENDMW